MGIFGWTRSDIGRLDGQTAIITGGNSGMGLETARTLLDHGASVIIASRNEELTRHAARDLEEEFPGASIAAKKLDLESFDSVKAFAQDILASGTPIHLLINMAGRFLDTGFSTTNDGIERNLAVSYWGHFYLTQLLLPRILESAPARIIIMSSPAEQFGTLDMSDLKGEKLHTSGMFAYGRSKMFNVMWAQELQRRLRLTGRDVECFPVHPGVVSTALFRKVSFRHPSAVMTYLFGAMVGQSPVQGAQSTLYAATEPSLKGKGGAFFGPNYQLNAFHAVARAPNNFNIYDADARVELYDRTISELDKMTGDSLNPLPGVPQMV